LAVKDLYDKACEAANRGNYGYAVELYRQVLRLEPDYPSARLLLRGVERRRLAHFPSQQDRRNFPCRQRQPPRRPGRQPAAGPQREAARRLGMHEQTSPRGLHFAHDDQEGGVQDLAPAERGVESGGQVQQGDQLGHALEQRRLVTLAPELVERLLVREHDRRIHGDPVPLRLTRQHTLRRAERRKVTESMIFSIRCTPRPPLRRCAT